MDSIRDILEDIEREDKLREDKMNKAVRPLNTQTDSEKEKMKLLTIETIDKLLNDGKINEAITVKICKKGLRDEEKIKKAAQCIDLAMAVVLSADSEDTFDEEAFDRLCILCGKTEDEMIKIMSNSCPACPDD